MIVCARCKLWMHENEGIEHVSDNGIYRRFEVIHRDGCPVKQEININQPELFTGDD